MESEAYVRRWLSGRAIWEGRLGGQVRIYDSSGEIEFGGQIHVWEPGRRIVFGWEAFRPFQHEETRVTIELIPEGEGTRVTIVHDQFGDLSDQDVESYREGWNGGNHEALLAKLVAEIAEGVA